MPRCPICRRAFSPSAMPAESAPAERPPLPFCSPRCKLLDLDNWLDGRYVVSEQLPFGEGDDGTLPEVTAEVSAEAAAWRRGDRDE